MPKIIFNEKGFPETFYTDEQSASASASALYITPAQWQEFLDNAGKRRWDGSAVVPYTPPFNEVNCATQIKSIAGATILAIASITDQLNLSARALELLELKVLGTATEADLTELEGIRTLNLRKKAILIKSAEFQAQYITEGNNLTAGDLNTIKAELETL